MAETIVRRRCGADDPSSVEHLRHRTSHIVATEHVVRLEPVADADLHAQRPQVPSSCHRTSDTRCNLCARSDLSTMFPAARKSWAAWTHRRLMVLESKARGKSCERADSEFPDGAEQLRYARSVDWTTVRALPLTLQETAVTAQVPKQLPLFHSTTTVSLIAESGTPRRASWRRSSRMSAMASARFARASSDVRPWPFAPGISGEYAMNHSSSRSMMAVNSLCMAEAFYRERAWKVGAMTGSARQWCGQLVPAPESLFARV